MLRYIRAFWIALKMTIRGESPPTRKYAEWHRWLKQGVEYLEQLAVQLQQGFSALDQKEIIFTIDRREISMSLILNALGHNLRREYPRLLQLNDPHSLTVIHASNMNDLYRLSRLIESLRLSDPAIQAAMVSLQVHLEAIPDLPEPQ